MQNRLVDDIVKEIFVSTCEFLMILSNNSVCETMRAHSSVVQNLWKQTCTCLGLQLETIGTNPKSKNCLKFIIFETVFLLMILSNTITRVSNRASSPLYLSRQFRWCSQRANPSNVSERTLLLLQRCIGVLYGLCHHPSHCTRF